MNTKLIKLREILLSKQKIIHNIVGRVRFENSRFCTDLSGIITKYNNQNEDQKSNNNKYPLYSYGYSFIYDDIVPQDDDYSETIFQNVNPKYLTFKSELLNNTKSVLNIKMFHQEYKKAMIHYHSVGGRHYIDTHTKQTQVGRKEVLIRTYQDDGRTSYCSQGRNLYRFSNGRVTQLVDIIETSFMKEYHVCALMIYCNFDKLQREFTKTYRKIDDKESEQDVFRRHSEFYWFGKHLRAAVNLYGEWWEHTTEITHNIIMVLPQK